MAASSSVPVKRVAGKLPGARADRIAAGRRQQVHSELDFLLAVEFGEFHAQQDLFFGSRRRQGQVVHHGLREAGGQRPPRSAMSLLDTTPVSETLSPGAVDRDLFVREGVFQQLAQRLQIHLHVYVVQRALIGVIPDDERSVPDSLGVNQDFARGARSYVGTSGLLVSIWRYRSGTQ